ncbi:MAG: hypothetical protein J0L76_14340 [Rhodobacterales bacterium]|nr:hypothetical protein [Rhodobacterales bacterium]
MTPILHSEPLALHVALDDIIRTHGRWRVLMALALRSLRPATPLPPLGLNDHLRRDIGLDPLPPGRDCLL